MVFIIQGKAYERKLREVIWQVLEKKHVQNGIQMQLKEVNDGMVTSLRTIEEET